MELQKAKSIYLDQEDHYRDLFIKSIIHADYERESFGSLSLPTPKYLVD